MEFEPLYATWRGIAQQKRDAEQTAYDRTRQGEMDARVRRQDLEGVINKAHELAKLGRGPEAVALLKMHGATAEDVEEMRPIEGQATADTSPMQQPAVPGGSAAPDVGGVEGGRSAQPQAQDDQNAAGMLGATGATVAPDKLQPPPFREQAPQPEPNPIVAAAAAGKERQAQRAHKFMRVSLPGGQTMNIDPEAERAAADTESARNREKNVAVLDASFGASSDEMIKKYYPQIRAAAAASENPIEPKVALDYMRQMAADESRGTRMDEHDRQIGDLRRELAGTNNAAALERAKVRGRPRGDGAGGADGFNPKVELSNARALKSTDTEINRWANASGYNSLHKAREEIERALEQVESGNPLGAAHALEKLTSVSRGGMATLPALALFQKHLTGVVGTIQGAVEQQRTGNFGDQQRKTLTDAVKSLMGSIDTQINAKHEEFVKSHYTPALYGLKGNIEDKEEAMFGDIGIHPRYDANAPTILPGSGRKAAPAGRGSNPITEANDANKVTITNKKTGEKKTVTREEAKRLGAL